MGFDAETAAEAGRKSGAARRRRKEPQTKAREALLSGAQDAAEAIISVMRASSGFEEVKPEIRFKAAQIILEYVLGKPRGFDPEDEEEQLPLASDLFSSVAGLEELDKA